MGTLYDDLIRNSRSMQPGGTMVRVTSDSDNPAISALLKLQAASPEAMEGLIKVVPSNGKKLRVKKSLRLRQLYKQVLDDMSQYLQDNGCEAASKYLDCIFEL